jgi:hypothetical protein
MKCFLCDGHVYNNGTKCRCVCRICRMPLYPSPPYSFGILVKCKPVCEKCFEKGHLPK